MLTRLPVPAQHGGQSNRGEREPNEPGNQMRARLRRGLGALRLAFVVVSHVRSSETHLSCIPTTLESESSSRHRGRKKNFGPQRCQGPTRFLRRAPFLDDRVDAFDHQDGDAPALSLGPAVLPMPATAASYLAWNCFLSEMKIALMVRQLDLGHILCCSRVVRVERAHRIIGCGVQKVLDLGNRGVIDFAHIRIGVEIRNGFVAEISPEYESIARGEASRCVRW
jgi:hypothetical protein